MQSEDGWWAFLDLCSSVKQPEQMDELFHLFLTDEERSALATRYLIVKHLMKNDLTQREMADRLGVSIAKITRGSNSLKIISLKLRGLLLKMLK